MRLFKKTQILWVFLFLFLIDVQNVLAKTIVVIGAGLSGLAAAHELQDAIQKEPLLQNQDLHLEVFEAKDRPGGRVFTVNLNGIPAELGGENINDGGEATHLRQLIQKMGLTTRSKTIVRSDSYYYDSQQGKTLHLYRDLMPSFPKLSESEIVNTLAESKKDALNLKQVIDRFFVKYEPKEPDSRRNYHIIREILEKRMKLYEGGSVEELSIRYADGSLMMMIQSLLKGYQAYQKDEPYSYPVESVEGGNSRLVLALSQGLGAKLHFQMPLREIRKHGKDRFSLLLGKKGAVKRILADQVILTPPCPVYKNIYFGAGTLSKERIGKILSVPYGTHAKILAPFFPQQKNLSVLMDGMAGWLHPDQGWVTLYFTGEAGVMKSHPDYLKGFNQGKQAFETAGFRLKPLSVVVPKQIFSSYDTAIGMSWASDPDIRSSYSYFSAAMSAEFEKDIEVDGERVLPLFAPVDGKIFFAGEHTAVDQDIRGTMEAAVESGVRASRLLLKQLKRDLWIKK